MKIQSKSIANIYFWSFLLTFLSGYSQIDNKQDFSEKVKIVLRQVGNELLLVNLDSTSLILPVKQIEENVFFISFQEELSFEPNQLVDIVKKNIVNTNLPTNYRVQVLQCSDNEVGYSYEVNIDEEKTIIPCAGRILPKNCYYIEVKFLKNTPFNNNPLFYLVFLFVFALVLVVLYRRRKKNLNSEIQLNYSNLGNFKFYPDQNKLIRERVEITLSKKECELLEIFVANKNKVVRREELTKRVWEDNGVIVGRSLDTYISKLRKKLQEDKAVKLVNVHGVGYKLEVNKVE